MITTDHQLPDKKANDIGWAIQVVAKYISWKNVCRHQAYQAKLLCNFYKIPCLIFIGFKKDPNKKEIEAHAWAVAGGKIITGFCNPNEYIIQSVYQNKWQ
ncbi:lasso peptide biosynthesis B2 protein [Niabella hibiscisoli]|nr:lasso peptide biosynthesis B2 protein [Niabella hibiscisoli]